MSFGWIIHIAAFASFKIIIGYINFWDEYDYLCFDIYVFLYFDMAELFGSYSILSRLSGCRMSILSSLVITNRTRNVQCKCLYKGYLHYKTITSQNVSSEAQIKNSFIL